ncbi:hypothetical protein [Janthinobacterium sp. HLS12-2]|uniref:hypothetical protein n=1 Tax=Janthinobacterium sp. HLS12-2 TaxID=1259324 RepID=UPI003F23A6E4
MLWVIATFAFPRSARARPAARVFARNELVPLQAQFMAINEWAGVEVVKFAPYDLATGGEGAV